MGVGFRKRFSSRQRQAPTRKRGTVGSPAALKSNWSGADIFAACSEKRGGVDRCGA